MELCREQRSQRGFNVCIDCGFKNFVRVPFCVVCGSAIEQYKSPSATSLGWGLWRRKPTLGLKTTPKSERSQAMTTRQRRPRFLTHGHWLKVLVIDRCCCRKKRKERVRKADTDNQLRWYRDAKFAGDGKGYIVRYQQSSRIQTPHDGELVDISIAAEQIPHGSLAEGLNIPGTVNREHIAQPDQEDFETRSSRRQPKLRTNDEQLQLIQDDAKSVTMLIVEGGYVDAPISRDSRAKHTDERS